jgi:hypothetical protein
MRFILDILERLYQATFLTMNRVHDRIILASCSRLGLTASIWDGYRSPLIVAFIVGGDHVFFQDDLTSSFTTYNIKYVR